MPNDFNTKPVGNEQDAAVSNRAPEKETSQQNHEEYWVKRWEGNDVLTLKGDNPIKDLQGLTVKTAPEIFNTTATSHIGDWTRAELIFNQYKLRGIQAAQLLTTITNAICDELVVQNFNSTENIKQFIASKLEEFTNTMPLSVKEALDTFSLAEIESLLKSFNENLQTTIDEKIIKYAEKKSSANVAKQILDSIQNIFETSRETPLCEFFNKEIQISGISNNIGLKNSLPTFIQQKGILDTAQHILTWLFTRYNVKYLPTCFNEEERQIVFYYNHEENKILGEITVPVYALHCYDGTNQFKYLNKANQLKSTMDRNFINPTNCKPLFILKINQSLIPLEDDDAKFDILSYEVKGANNFDLNNICCDADLIPGFKNIMDELNSLDGSNGEALFKFAANWVNYAYTNLPKESTIRTGKLNPGGDEDIESLELIAKFYFQTNPEALITFNKKLVCLGYLNPWNDVSEYYLIVLKSFHQIINLAIGKDSESDNLFTLNVAQREEKFANFSGIIHSISEKLTKAHNLFNANFLSDPEIDITEHNRNKRTNIYSLTCDFTSLALTIEKLNLTKDISKFKDLVHFEEYDANALQCWEKIAEEVKRNPSADQEVIGYLEKGVAYFKSLMNPQKANNLVEVDNYVEGITETLKVVSGNANTYDQFKAHIITNPLAKQREFCENKFTVNVGNKFSEELINIEKLMYKETVEEFAAGRTLKQVIRGEAAQICDKTIKLINTTVSKKSTAEKKAEIHKYKKETSALTTKEIIWSAVAAVAAAAVSFIGGFSLARFAIKYGWFSYQAKQQSNEIARCADELNAATTKEPQRSASIPNC